MTKAKGMLSAEEHKKAEEERKRHFRLEIADIGSDCVSIKSPIVISRKQYDFIQKVCDITGERLENYIKDALLQMIQIDLESPSCLGQQVCKVLREEWNPIKPK